MGEVITILTHLSRSLFIAVVKDSKLWGTAEDAHEKNGSRHNVEFNLILL